MKTLHAMCAVLVVCLQALLPTPILSQVVSGTCRCLNGGLCVEDAAMTGLRCQCQSGYTGILCEQTLLIDDRIPPVIFNCPSDFEVRRQAGQPSVFVTWEEPYATDNSGQAPLVFRNVAPDFYASGNYIFNVIYRYTDQAGLVADCRFAITVLYSEETQPIYTGCPSDINMRIQTGISTAVYWTEPVASPTYQATTSITKSHSPGSIFYVGSTTVTYTFTEFTTGIKSPCTFAVEISADICRCENGGTCFPDAAMTGIMCQCRAGYTGTLCDENTCQCQNNGVCQYDATGIMCQCPAGYSGLLCEQVDGDCKCQNGGTCVDDAPLPGGTMCVCAAGFTGLLCETSVDSIPPTVTFCPDDIVVNSASNQPVYITWPEPTAVDNSGIAPSVVQTVNSGIFVQVGSVIPVRYTFTDAAGNFALCEFIVSGQASNCECQNGATCVHDDTVPGGTMCVCTAGYTGILCETSSTVDSIPPTVTFCPDDIVVNSASNQPVYITWPEPTAVDNSGIAPSVVQTVNSGIFVQVGSVVPVRYTFTDAAGNFALCEFTVSGQASNCECQNGATCVDDATFPGGTMCVCAAGYTGILCETSSAVDSIPPTVTFCPDDIVVNSASNQPVYITWPEPTAVDNSGIAPSIVQTVNSGIFVQVGSVIPVKYTFTDAAGNFALCEFTVSGQDTVAPVVDFCPPDITATAAAPDAVMFVTWALPKASDNSGQPVKVTSTAMPGIFVVAGSMQTVTYTFTDGSNNQATCSFNIIIEAPYEPGPIIINCPSDVMLNITDISSMASGIWLEPTATRDGLIVPIVEQSHQSGASFGAGETVVRYLFRDSTGAAECVFTVTVTVILEVPQPPTDVNIVNVTSTSALVTWTAPDANFDSYRLTTISPGSTVVASVDPSQKSLELSALVPGTDYTVEVATALGSEFDSQIVSTPVAVSFKTVAIDTIPPVISGCPDDIILPAASNSANWTEPTAIDDSGLVPAVSKSHEPGSVFALGSSTNVTYTFTDQAGNAAECVFIVNRLLDTTPPVISGCPDDIILPAASNSANWTEPTAADDSGLVPAVSKSHEPGSVFALGSSTNVTYTFTDQAGNAAECVFNINRLQATIPPPPPSPTPPPFSTPDPSTSTPAPTTPPFVDTTPPVIENCLSYVILPNCSNCGTWLEPTATDDSGEPPMVSKTHQAGFAFPEGSTVVTYTFTDAAGNQAECSFEVFRLQGPVDMPPVISGCPSDITLPLGVTVANWTEPTATDDTGVLPTVTKSHEPGSNFSGGNTTVSYMFTDRAGNSAVCSFVVVVTFDTLPPVISDCPSDVILPHGMTVANWTEPTATDNSGNLPTVVKSHEPGTNFSEGSIVTYTFTDGAGNEAVCSFLVVILDNRPPSVSDCPSDVLLPLDETIANWVEPTALDDTGDAPLVIKSHERGSSFPDGNTTVTYRFIDGAGNQAVCSFMVVVTLDTLPPVISDCPSDVILPLGMTVADWTEPTATDNSGNLPLGIKSHEQGTNFAEGNTTVSYTFIDDAGNQASCEFIVVVTFDTLPPVISDCPSDVILPLGMTVTNWTEPTATDNSDNLPTVFKSHEPGTTFAEGNTSVSYLFFDGAGNLANCTFIVVVTFDTLPPVISDCPSEVILPLGMTVANWTEPTATDNSGNLPTVYKSHEPGTNFAEGNTTVLYFFVDDAGNQANCTFFVVVTFDTLPPVISDCPSDVILPLGMTVANWTEPTATDNSGDLPIVIKSYEPGTAFAEGNTTVSYIFIDGAGNQANCTFMVVVTFDALPPVISDCPSDVILPLGMTVADWTEPTATDNSGNLPIVIKSHEPGTNFAEGNTTVSYTFIDDAGNQANCTFIVVVTFDTLPPVISDCPSDVILPLGMTVANWTEPTATDNSDNLPIVIKSHEPGTTFAEGSTTVSYLFIDDAGNQANCTFIVVVTFDTLPPVISDCPSDVILPLGMTVADWTEPTATDNSGNLPIVIKSHEPGTTFAEGNTTVSYIFFDGAGNQANCEFTVVVTLDTLPPVVSDCPSDVILPLGMTVANWTEPTATDNSGNLPTLIKSHEPGTDFPEGNTTVSYTFIDDAGNQANCAFVVVVTLDRTAPVVMNCPSNVSIPYGSSTASWSEPTATDNAGPVTNIIRSHTPGSTFLDEITMVTYTFTDAQGNQANCVFLVIRLGDDVPPEISGCPSTVVLPPGVNEATWDEPTAVDNSGEEPTVTNSLEPGSTVSGNTTTVVYTFTDAAGNQANCVFFVKTTPVDLPPMVFACPESINVSLLLSEVDEGASTIWAEPSAIDDSGVEPTLVQTHAPGSKFPLGETTVTYTYSDQADNQANCSFVVTVNSVDDVPPAITGCPSNMTLELPLQQPNIVGRWTEPSAMDESGEAPSISKTHTPGDSFPEGATRVTYTFTDGRNNQEMCSFYIIVVREADTLPPSIINCPSSQAFVIPAGNRFMIVMWNTPSSIDNSGEQAVQTSNKDSGDVFEEGVTPVMYNFTDAAGNVATCEFTITLSTPVLNPCQTRPCRSNENCFYSSNDYICVPGAFRRRRETLHLKDKIGRFIADEINDPCPCMNGGTCSSDDHGEGTRCNCASGFSGILCQEDDKPEVDSFTLTWWHLVTVASLFLLIILSIVAYFLPSKTQKKSVQRVYDVTNNI